MNDETDSPAAEERPLQFTLQHLLLLTLAVALFLSIGVWLHWFVAIGLAIAACFVGGAIAGRITRVEGTIVAVSLLLAVPLLLSLFSSAGPAARRAVCVNRLKQIGLALHNYASAHGCLPPAVITDANGRPMHSWRVLILPYMEQKALYDQYSFDEPWDGPNNTKLHSTFLSDFLCPEENGLAADTSYVAVTGPGTAWGTNRGVPIADITDGASSTIAVVEVATSGIHWMEPRDLDVRQMPPGINPKNGRGISSLHAEGAAVLFVDGLIRTLPEDTPPKDIQAMLTIAGGEEVVLDE